MGESAYRLTTGALLLVMLLVRSSYGLAARRRRGRGVGRARASDRLAIAGVGASLALLGAYVVVPFPSALHLPFPAYARWSGAALFAAGDALFWRAHASLGSAWTVGELTSEGQALVTTGPYRFVRHPMYSAVMLTVVGALLLTANALAGGVYLLTTIALYVGRIGHEERALLEAFGDDYRRYMERTGRLLPRSGVRSRSRNPVG